MPIKSIPDYKGKIYFYKCLDYGGVMCLTERQDGSAPAPGDEYIEIGSTDVDVAFITDTREKEIEALEADMAKKAIEHQHYLDTMNGKIQSLRAIEHTEK